MQLAGPPSSRDPVMPSTNYPRDAADQTHHYSGRHLIEGYDDLCHRSAVFRVALHVADADLCVYGDPDLRIADVTDAILGGGIHGCLR